MIVVDAALPHLRRRRHGGRGALGPRLGPFAPRLGLVERLLRRRGELQGLRDFGLQFIDPLLLQRRRHAQLLAPAPAHSVGRDNYRRLLLAGCSVDHGADGLAHGASNSTPNSRAGRAADRRGARELADGRAGNFRDRRARGLGRATLGRRRRRGVLALGERR